MLYTIVKHIHITAVVLSGLLFLWRGLRALMSYNNNAFAYRVLPHIIDTVLLVSAIYLSYLMQQYPFVHAWLTAKVIGLIVYIVFGYMAVKRAKGFVEKLFYFLLAVATFIYIIGAAHLHTPWSWLIRYL